MATDPTRPHRYVRHWDHKPGCALCGLTKANPIHQPVHPSE